MTVVDALELPESSPSLPPGFMKVQGPGLSKLYGFGGWGVGFTVYRV